MKIKLAACFFTFLESLMLAGQITTLVSTYWTSWDLRFNWTEVLHAAKHHQIDGELVSMGHAGLWSRCIRVYDTSRNVAASVPYRCLNNYNTSSESLRFTFGQACKTATAALCVGDAAVIVIILALVVISTFKRNSQILLRVLLPILLFQGLICFTIPLTYLSGNMAELIDQLSGAYSYLMIVHMTPWYKHDWAFWTQVALVGLWTVSVAVFIIYYSFKYAQSCPKATKPANGKNERGDSTELEALRN